MGPFAFGLAMRKNVIVGRLWWRKLLNLWSPTSNGREKEMGVP
jgi:hypothetical protein